MALDSPPQPTRLRVHLVADDLDPTHSEAQPVSSWPNRGTADDAAPGAGQPVFRSDVDQFNGHDAVEFDGAGDNMLVNSGLESPVNKNEATVFAVLRQIGVQNQNHPYFAWYASGTERTSLVSRQDNADGNTLATFSTDDWPSSGWRDTGVVLDSGASSRAYVIAFAYEWTGVINEGRGRFWVNSFDNQVLDAGVSKDLVNHDRYFVADGGTTAEFAGQIAEILVWDVLLTDTEIEDVMDDLTAQYVDVVLRDDLTLTENLTYTITTGGAPPGEGPIGDPGWEDAEDDYNLWHPVTIERLPHFNRLEPFEAALKIHQTREMRNKDFVPTVDHFGQWAVTTDLRFSIAVSSRKSITDHLKNQGKP